MRNVIFYDGLQDLLLFWFGGAVKAEESQSKTINQWVNDERVCSAALGLARVCKLHGSVYTNTIFFIFFFFSNMPYNSFLNLPPTMQ